MSRSTSSHPRREHAKRAGWQQVACHAKLLVGASHRASSTPRPPSAARFVSASRSSQLARTSSPLYALVLVVLVAVASPTAHLQAADAGTHHQSTTSQCRDANDSRTADAQTGTARSCHAPG